MATSWVAQRAGNWSVVSGDGASPWHDGGAQTALNTIPAGGDSVDLMSFDVAQDAGATTIPPTGALVLLKATTTGRLTVNQDTITTAVLNVATLTTGTATTGLVATSGTVSTTNTFAVSNNGSACAATGGDGASMVCVYHGSKAVLNITASAVGGTASATCAIHNASSGTVNMTGNGTGGSGIQAAALRNSTSGVFNVSNGTLTGNATATQSPGMWAGGPGPITLTNVNMVNTTNGSSAYTGKTPTWTNTSKANYAQWGSTKYGPEPAAAQMLSGVVCGSTTGAAAKIPAIGRGGLVG